MQALYKHSFMLHYCRRDHVYLLTQPQVVSRQWCVSSWSAGQTDSCCWSGSQCTGSWVAGTRTPPGATSSPCWLRTQAWRRRGCRGASRSPWRYQTGERWTGWCDNPTFLRTSYLWVKYIPTPVSELYLKIISYMRVNYVPYLYAKHTSYSLSYTSYLRT